MLLSLLPALYLSNKLLILLLRAWLSIWTLLPSLSDTFLTDSFDSVGYFLLSSSLDLGVTIGVPWQWLQREMSKANVTCLWEQCYNLWDVLNNHVYSTDENLWFFYISLFFRSSSVFKLLYKECIHRPNFMQSVDSITERLFILYFVPF